MMGSSAPKNSAAPTGPPSATSATNNPAVDTEPGDSDDSASQIIEAASIQVCGATGPWAYRVNGFYIAKFDDLRPEYHMVRDEGMNIFIRYGIDGFWRVMTNESDEAFAQTIKAKLHRPYGPGVEWEVKLNMLGESGMEPVPDLQVIPLNKDETLYQKVAYAKKLEDADREAHNAPAAVIIRGQRTYANALYIATGEMHNKRKLYQHECARSWLRYCPNGLWMLCYKDAMLSNNNVGFLKTCTIGFASPCDAQANWFCLESKGVGDSNQWVKIDKLQIVGLNERQLEEELRMRFAQREDITRQALMGPRQLIIRGCTGRLANLINGFYEAKPLDDRTLHAVEEAHAEWTKLPSHLQSASKLTDKQRKHLYNGRLAYQKETSESRPDNKMHPFIHGHLHGPWLRYGQDDIWFVSPYTNLAQFDRCGYMWSKKSGSSCPSEVEEWNVVCESDKVEVRSIRQVALEYVKLGLKPESIPTLLEFDKSNRALPLVRAAMKARREQIQETQRFPLSLFCIITASVRSTNASVMVHGCVRKLLACYLGIDVPLDMDDGEDLLALT